MSKPTGEVVHEGWLIKSPPTKRIWRARWRRRWFTLRHTGELPGQYFLEYYTDRKCRKLKGTIDLDQCEQVDAGLRFEQRKFKYPYMFDIKTPSRVYYLAAESEQDMNSWVDYICQVCGLKAFSDEQELQISSTGTLEFVDIEQPENRIENTVPETPPLSPISGPYIPISECITGRPINSTGVQDFYCLLSRNATNTALNTSGVSDAQESDSAPFVPPTPQKRKHQQQSSISSNDIPNDVDPRFYDLPRQLQLPQDAKNNGKWMETYMNSSAERATTPPLQSPTDSESVFTDEESRDEWTHPVLPSENGIKEPRPSDSSIEMEPSSWSVVQRFGKLTVVDTPAIKAPDNILPVDEAPPRPPKPLHLGKGPSYLNLGSSPKSARSKNNSKEQVELLTPGNNPNSEKSQNQESDPSQAVSDETYDFPRSHVMENEPSSKSILSSRHCYNNAAPSIVDGQVFRYDTTTTEAMNADQQFDVQDEEPASPCSQSSCSTAAQYSNLPSPLLPETQGGSGPPLVNRCLKPGRKPSDSASICSLPEPSSPRSAPNVDRKLKPSSQIPVRKTSEFEFDHGSLRLPRAAPSPTPPAFAARDDEFTEEQVYFYQYNNQFSAVPQGSKDFDKLQYLDLDLESDAHNGTIPAPQPPKSPGPLTVYKTVDFVKTEAFKRTRQCVEDRRKNVA